MNTSMLTRAGRSRRRLVAASGVVAASVATALIVPLSAGQASAATAPANGIVCDNGGGTSSSRVPVDAAHPDGIAHGTKSFVVTAKTGQILTPDANSIYMWGYSPNNDAYQYPGPVLCVTEGDQVSVSFHNALPVASSMHFPGLQEVDVNGQPSVADLTTGSFTAPVAAGGTATYTFTADRAGTFLYESGTDPELQRQMGLFGALVVRPLDGANQVYDAPATPAPGFRVTTFHAGWEFMHILSEVDPNLHQSVLDQLTGGATSVAYDMGKYKAAYWFVNGRSFPDTIEDNYASHLPSQPYGALVHIWPNGPGNDQPAVVRYVNAGPVAYPFHPHSDHEQIVGQDAAPMTGTNGSGQTTDVSVDRYAIVVPPGGTMEGMFGWYDAQSFGSADSSASGVGVPMTNDRVRTDGAYWSGSPFLGDLATDLNPAQTKTFNICGEYYHVAHSHALQQATTNGATMGGMLTMIRIDPPANPADLSAGPAANCEG